MAGAGDVTTGRRIRGLDADERRAQRREQLLDAMLDQVATHGYAGTSIERVCQTAYVATRSFYELFDSKEACYLALFQRSAEEVGGRMVEVFAAAPDDPTAAVRNLIEAFAHALVDDPRIARASFGEGNAVSPTIERARRANRRWSADFLVDVWRRYGIAPRRPDDIDAIAVAVIGGMFDLVVDWLPEDSTDSVGSGDFDALVRDLAAFYEVVQDGMLSSAR